MASGIIDDEDPDPSEDFPEWSKTIILLLDYAMIEGVRWGMHTFVHLLDAARSELQEQVTLYEKQGKAAIRRRRTFS